MDLRSYGQRPYIIAAPIAFAIFFVGVCLGAAIDPSWLITRHNLSDLGTGKRTLACAILFDYACCAAGFLISVFGVGKYMFEEKLNKASGVFFIIGGFGLFMVGIWNAEWLTLHNISAGFFGIAMAIAIVLSSISDILERNRLVLISGILILAFLAICWPLFGNAIAESISIGCATVWFLIQLHKYWKNGQLGPVTPAADCIAE